MVFPVTFTIIQPEKGFPRSIKACVSSKESNEVLSNIGTFRYYQFLRDLFEDLSKFHRIGNLSFVKPGLENLCISWTVIETMSKDEVEESVIDGLENLNRTHIQKYKSKYSLSHSVPFRLSYDNVRKEDSFQVILKLDFHHTERVSTIALKV